MATVDVHPPSDFAFKQAAETVESWTQAGPTDQQTLEVLNKAIDGLGRPETNEKFKTVMKDLGIRAVKTDEAFDRIKKTMDDFVKREGHRFPDIAEYQKEWNGYFSTWSSYVTTSRDLAIKTAAEYESYTVFLEAFHEITTKADMNKLARGLKEFAKNQPVGIPIDFKDKFLGLKRNVLDFQKRFNRYLDEQKVQLDAQADSLKNEIDNLKLVIKGLDQQIKDAILGLEIASIFGPLGSIIAGTALAILALMRSAQQKKLDAKVADLRKVEGFQTALGEIKTQFAGLVPEFELLAENLNLFADTWNTFHNEAVTFATKFEALEKPDQLPSIYKRRIDLSLKVSVPLTESLKAYAEAIHS